MSKLTKSKFIELADKYRPVIKGKGRQIADSIGMDYWQFKNALRGSSDDIEVMEQIIEGIQSFIKELNQYLEEIEV